MLHWLWFHAGLSSGNSAWYLFPSAWGSIILPPLITLGGVGLLWCWHNQCGVHHCYWPTVKKTAAGDRACWKHHPHPKRTVHDLHEAHRAVLRLRHHAGKDGEEAP